MSAKLLGSAWFAHFCLGRNPFEWGRRETAVSEQMQWAHCSRINTWNSWSSFFSIQSVTWARVTSLSPSLGRAFSSRWGGVLKPYLQQKRSKLVQWPGLLTVCDKNTLQGYFTDLKLTHCSVRQPQAFARAKLKPALPTMSLCWGETRVHKTTFITQRLVASFKIWLQCKLITSLDATCMRRRTSQPYHTVYASQQGYGVHRLECISFLSYCTEEAGKCWEKQSVYCQ